MALITPGSLAGQISGRVGSVVYSHNRGGPYVRNGTIPVTVTSTDALAQKARVAYLSQAWRDLTSTQQLAWEAWADVNQVINRLGARIRLTGHQSYIRLNTNVIYWGNPPISDPPILPAPAPCSSLSLAVDIAAGTAEVTYAPTPLDTDDRLRCWVAVVDSPGITYVHNLLRLTATSAKAHASPLDIYTAITARFGSLVAGQTIHLQADVCTDTNGQISQRQATSTVAVAGP
jgi:hypothetical protein